MPRTTNSNFLPKDHLETTASTLTQAQVKNDHSFILQEAWKPRAQVFVKAGIVIQPPKSRPSEDHEVCPRLSKSLKLADCGVVVRRGSPVFPLALKERHAPFPCPNQAAKTLLVHEDDGVPGGYQGGDLLGGQTCGEPKCQLVVWGQVVTGMCQLTTIQYWECLKSLFRDKPLFPLLEGGQNQVAIGSRTFRTITRQLINGYHIVLGKPRQFVSKRKAVIIPAVARKMPNQWESM